MGWLDLGRAHGQGIDRPGIEAARCFDLMALAVLLPLGLVVGSAIAVAIVIDSPGPVFFRCQRVGRNGRQFSMLKFRTMTRDAHGHVLRAHGDGRQTPLGRLLSQTRLNELPQLINVLRGEMRLVGPRPELDEFVAEAPEAYARILSVPPGITGSTQLAFADESRTLAAVATPHRRRFYVERILPVKTEMDVAYVRSRTLAGDLRILLRTVAVPVIRRRPAQPRRAELRGRAVTLVTATVALGALYAIQIATPPV